MFTPGIEALSRLGCQATGSVAEKVPVEVWTRIGDFLTSISDLVNLAPISPQALSAAADLSRYPWVEARGYPIDIDEFRLEDVVGSAPPIQETTRNTKRRVIRKHYHQLGRAKFTAVIDGRRVTVDLVQDDEFKRHHLDKDEDLECLVPGKRVRVPYSWRV
ncbi:hypothetical protein BGY98DRAFT_993514 [Russula aff. rugulosa BPL654]|nr:hypothetical protein BGY98DRAFT_993514 [Russula aff. rugulosa BPL654]